MTPCSTWQLSREPMVTNDTSIDDAEAKNATCRQWLRANGYCDVAEQIDRIMARWIANGKKTRRNWWELLAGDKNGHPRIAGGEQLPVLAAAQLRLGRAVTRNARRAGMRGLIPPVRHDGRWPQQ